MSCKVYNIPFREDGLTLLSQHLHKVSRGNPLSLCSVTVLLPTRRACRRLNTLLQQHASCATTLLPRVIALGDLGQSLFQEQPFLSSEEALGKTLTHIKHLGDSLSLSESLPLAKAFLELEKEGSLHQINWQEGLKRVFPDDLAQHRQSSLLHLEKVIEGLKSVLPFFPGARQAQALQTFLDAKILSAHSDHHDPASNQSLSNRVYAYGLFPKNPLEQAFLKNLVQHPEAMVWLSGLDRQGPETEFALRVVPHPQACHAALLTSLGQKRAEIPDWPACQTPPLNKTSKEYEANQPLKESFTHQIFQETFEPEKPASRHIGLSTLVCRDSQEESRLIALVMRQTLEKEGQKALFVTTETSLARSVMEELKRYDLYPDTGSGFPFAWTEAGSFLNLALDAITTHDDFAKLCLLKHPLSRLGKKAQETRSKARQFERLRLRSSPAQPMPSDLKDFLDLVDRVAAPLKKALSRPKDLHRPADLFQTHLQLCETLSQDETNCALIWSQEVGNLSFETCKTLLKTLSHFPSLSAKEYPGLIRSLIKSQTIRASHSVHPRLLILDPDQASLQKADLLVIGGMVETCWPQTSRSDPWLSEEMKKSLSLTTQIRQRSLESHLFTELLESFPTVLMTMPARSKEGPQKTSPFLKRLETAAKSQGICLKPPIPWHQWTKELVRVKRLVPMSRPQPCPPTHKRPRHLSITDIETLHLNPYLFYLQKILNLRPFPDLQPDPGPALLGTLLHEIFEAFLRQQDHSWEKLMSLGQDKMAPYQDSLAVRYFWQSQFEACAQWFLSQQASLEPKPQHFLEWTGSLKRPFILPEQQQRALSLFPEDDSALPPQPILKISGKADRLDLYPQGRVRIIDYKSGRLPSRKELYEGGRLQLPLEALILKEGGFQRLPRDTPLESLEYWQLKDPCQRVAYTDHLEDLVGQATQILETLITTYYDQEAPFSAPFETTAPPCFTPLVRTQEWLSNLVS